MTGLAVLAESAGGMVRVLRAGVVRRVALVTAGIGQLIVVVRVTIGAGNAGMMAGQREGGGRVVELSA